MTTEAHENSERNQSSGLASTDLLGLANAATAYAASFDGDLRQDAKTDVLNAFFAGAKFGAEVQREALEKARGALAGIGTSADMTLAMARKKAKRAYLETGVKV